MYSSAANISTVSVCVYEACDRFSGSRNLIHPQCSVSQSNTAVKKKNCILCVLDDIHKGHIGNKVESNLILTVFECEY